MSSTPATTPDVVTLINILNVAPANQEALLALLRQNTDTVVSQLDGWISTTFIAALDGSKVVIHSQWRDLESVQAMRTSPGMQQYFSRILALATFDSFPGHVAYARHA